MPCRCGMIIDWRVGEHLLYAPGHGEPWLCLGDGLGVWNPAFDVTPANLITAWVTEERVWDTQSIWTAVVKAMRRHFPNSDKVYTNRADVLNQFHGSRRHKEVWNHTGHRLQFQTQTPGSKRLSATDSREPGLARCDDQHKSVSG